MSGLLMPQDYHHRIRLEKLGFLSHFSASQLSEAVPRKVAVLSSFCMADMVRLDMCFFCEQVDQH